MDFKVIFGSIGAIICFFFGVIFALASGASGADTSSRLAVSAILFIMGCGVVVILYVISKKPARIIHQVELSGEMKAVPIQCPSCGGSIDPQRIKIKDGVPYATCRYCGKTVEVAEEPKW
ncbi:MAG: hypothetical protein JSV35_03525 [Candidatus Bathyarchaeota archaeon]|nr:MAG: hypothetical protein JSV35_03525 [Candidatus Bathyarchaeota archaeon]